MSDFKSISGKCVLIVEDDFYQSRDVIKSIENAGCVVVTTTPDADEACASIKRDKIDFALVDINLGYGPAFETARALRRQGIPFIFTTGYDAASIPEDLQGVAIIQKPFDQAALMDAIAGLT